MKYIAIVLIIASIITCCNTKTSNNSGLPKPDDVPASEYVINIDRDTTLVTINGAVLKIPKGSLRAATNKVTLEIKEAYSIQQMIAAGLLTESDGEPLSSGGMIYINAKAGQDVKITQAINVALPTDYLAKDMQLYKGEKDAYGNINWRDPKPLPENKQLANVDRGKTLFQQMCSACHAIDKDATGPKLAHYLKWLPQEKNAWKYVPHYPDQLPYYTPTDTSMPDLVKRYTSHALYLCNFRQIFSSVGTAFEMSPRDFDKIYRYIENESGRRGLRVPDYAHLDECADSSYRYNAAITELNHKKQEAGKKRSTLIANNGPLTEERRMERTVSNGTGTSAAATPPAPVFDDIVSLENNQAVYYQFSIETFGWYNIDILLKNISGNLKSELFVRMTGEYREKLDIFLIIPAAKVYAKGGPVGNDRYGFAYKDGSIYLPQQATAYIMAVKETHSSIAFVIKEFTTSMKQDLELSLRESTKEEFKKAISIIGNDRIWFDVKDSKNAGEIRKADTEIKNIDQAIKQAEQWKPKGCDCRCGYPADSTKATSMEIGK